MALFEQLWGYLPGVLIHPFVWHDVALCNNVFDVGTAMSFFNECYFIFGVVLIR